MTHDCLQCGQAFTHKGTQQMFCSPSCWYAFKRQTPNEATCGVCGVAFIDRNAARNRGRPVSCSLACRRRRQSEDAEGRYQRKLARIKGWKRQHPRIALAGETYQIDKLPSDLKPVAQLIRETRQELRKRTG